MKTIFDSVVNDEVISRIQWLTADNKGQWGKMNVFQMSRHCNLWSEWVLGKGIYTNHTYRQDLLGKIFGKWALKANTKSDKPMGKNMPAGMLVVKSTEVGDLDAEKERWLQNIAGFRSFSNNRFVHDFFGKMSTEQIGIFAYKHFDHHLRQFGV